MDEDTDIMVHLRASAREVAARNKKAKNVVRMRRWLVAISDILDIYLNFQRDKKWDERDW